MQTISDLQQLISEMNPILHPELWVYCTIEAPDITPELITQSFALVRESESITLITTVEQAANLGFVDVEPFQRIELQVYSSLEAVGLTAAVSQCLKEHNISANVVAAYHHDHILLPKRDAQKALTALLDLTEQKTVR
ncbi:ACT domain-containing protein [Planctobacterium marinum]|uniref:Transporter n=1 Tax=Planctobacterium marinum TaxID=1631968 RepID=A0AA48HHT6_9ALTE|nr:transporter [Planctobacterium marinum]